MANYQRWLEEGLEKHRRGELPAAENLYRRVLVERPRQVDALYLLGKLKYQCRQWDESIALLKRSVSADPKYGLAHLALALALEQKGEIREALTHFLKAHELDPRSSQPLYNLANAHASLGDNKLAEKRYREALAIDPDFAAAHNNLGTLLQREGRWSESLDGFRKAIAADRHCVAAYANQGFLLVKLRRGAEAVSIMRQGIANNPRSADAYTNLNRLLRDLGDIAGAEQAARKAVELEPGNFSAHNELGKTLQLAGRPDEAEAAYRQAITLNGRVAETWNNLGTAVVQQHKAGDSLECYQRAVEIDPKYAGAWSNFGNAHLDRDELEEAARCFHAVARISKNPSLWSFRAETLCPTLIDTNDEIDRFREGIVKVLHRYQDTGLAGGMAELLESACQPSFNFPFHGRNDRALKEEFAKVFTPLFPAESPKGSGELPHVGVLITHDEWAFRRSVGGIFDRMDPTKLRITVVCTPGGVEKLRLFFTSPHVGFLPMAQEIDKTIASMREARFDAIYHWEVATTAASYFLPYCRLAPIQMTSWGIQVTSGIPAIDYYIGTDLAELPEAETHYSERLVRMRTMMSCQPRMPMPSKPEPRESFGLDPQDHVYLCPQQFGKFHPDFDPFLRGILERDPKGRLVLIEGKHAVLREKLLRRFRATLGDAAERVHFVPRLQGDRYSSLFRSADVLLDPYHFGGVNTTYDAISLGKAVVTLPSTLQRGRYTLGCYRQMGYLECVADSREQYVEKAVKIACDESHRQAVETAIWETGARLFDRSDSAEELEAFLLSAVAESSRAAGKTDWVPRATHLGIAGSVTLSSAPTPVTSPTDAQPIRGPFAVCYFEPADPARASAWREVAGLLTHALISLGHPTKFLDRAVDPASTNLIVGVEGVFQPGILQGARHIFLQPRPLHALQSTYSAAELAMMRDADEIWDFSPENVRQLRQLGIARVRHVPIGYHDKLRKVQRSQQDIDVLLLASRNSRQIGIYRELAEQCAVTIGGTAKGELRDDWIARAKLLLLVADREGEPIEDPVVAYLLANRGCVVCEESESNTWGNGVKTASFSELVPVCLRLLASQEDRYRQAKLGFDKIRERPMTEILAGIVGHGADNSG